LAFSLDLYASAHLLLYLHAHTSFLGTTPVCHYFFFLRHSIVGLTRRPFIPCDMTPSWYFGLSCRVGFYPCRFRLQALFPLLAVAALQFLERACFDLFLPPSILRSPPIRVPFFFPNRKPSPLRHFSPFKRLHDFSLIPSFPLYHQRIPPGHRRFFPDGHRPPILVLVPLSSLPTDLAPALRPILSRRDPRAFRPP